MISSTPIALLSNGDLVLGSSTLQHLMPAPVLTPPSAFPLGNQIVTLAPNNIIVSRSMLKPNDPALTIDGAPVLIGPSVVHIGSSVASFNAPTLDNPARIATASVITTYQICGMKMCRRKMCRIRLLYGGEWGLDTGEGVRGWECGIRDGMDEGNR